MGEKAAPSQGRDPSPCVQHPRRLIRQSQAGRFYSQEEGGGGGQEEEFSVVVSHNREVQRPGGDRVARAALGTRPRHLAGWLAQRVQQNSNNKTR